MSTATKHTKLTIPAIISLSPPLATEYTQKPNKADNNIANNDKMTFMLFCFFLLSWNYCFGNGGGVKAITFNIEGICLIGCHADMPGTHPSVS